MDTAFAHSPNSTAQRPDSRRRGNALITALVVTAVLASVAGYACTISLDASQRSLMRENYEQARYAAEYGAEVALGALTRMEYDIDGKLTNDWVGSNLYVDGSSATSPDSRRIGGTWGDQEFRVQVRSARRAYANDSTRFKNWILQPSAFTFGTSPNSKFTDYYEITSTARSLRAGDAGAAKLGLTPAATVRTVVSLASNDQTGSMLDGSPAFVGEMPGDFLASNATISGEDHYLDKLVNETVTKRQGVEKKTTTEANYFGAKGDYWKNGFLTLNYEIDANLQKGAVNPIRPHTNTFSTTINNDRRMLIKDNSRKPDLYLLGGKKSKTVVLVETKADLDTTKNQGVPSAFDISSLPGGVIIKEVADSQANEGGAFNVVLNSYEDLNRLYINMAATGLTTPSSWWQHYVGEYTKNAYKPNASRLDPRSFPYDNYDTPAVVRPKSLHFILNKNEEMLVREFKNVNNGKVDNFTDGTTKYVWTGKYRWAPYVHNGTGTNSAYMLANVASNGTKTSSGNFIQPRWFQWQELLGYRLQKQYFEGPPALRMYAPSTLEMKLKIDGQDTMVKVNDGTQRTYPELDGAGETTATGFDELWFQQRDSAAATTTKAADGLTYLKANSKSARYVKDAKDSIWVWNKDTNVYDEKKSMDDFLFDKNFGTSADPDIRKALAIFVAYEDLVETGADFNYTDLMFTIWVAPGSMSGSTAVTSRNSEQWWEREESDGLTGKDSTAALGTNSDGSTDGSLAQNYALLGYLSSGGKITNNIYTMVKNGEKIESAGFNRAHFVTDDKDPNFGKVTDTTPGVYYYTDSDLEAIMQKDLLSYAGLDRTEQLTKAKEEMARLNGINPLAAVYTTAGGITLKHISTRWDPDEIERADVANGDPTAYKLMDNDLTIRLFAANVFGGQQNAVPSVYTDEAGTTRLTKGQVYDADTVSKMPPAQQAELFPVRNVPLGFLATEFKQKENEPGLTPATPPSVEFKKYDTFQADGTKYEIKLKQTVAACYVPYEFPEDNAKKQGDLITYFGTKEKRYSIGFHRGGDGEKDTNKITKLKDGLLLDHYEYIALAKDGFNPYVTYHDSNDGNDYIVMRRYQTGTEGGDPVYSYYPMFKPGYTDANTQSKSYPDAFPTFTFSDPIDGAGVMVVYGNMVVQDTFAYHGILVVLGDLIVDPVYKTGMAKYGKDGNLMDDEGHSLALDGTKYYYVGDDGKKVYKDKDGKDLKPATENGFRGELIVQGRLMVRGKTITNTNAFMPPGAEVPIKGTGKLSVYASDQALNEVITDGDDSFRVTRVHWVNDGDIDVSDIWNNKLN